MEQVSLQVVNREINVGFIRVIAVAASSVMLIGDTRIVNTSSVLDVPPESIGPLVPLAPER